MQGMTEEKLTVEEWWANMLDDLIWRSVEEDEHLAWYGQVEAGYPRKEDIAQADMEKVMEKLYPVVRGHIEKILSDFVGMERFGHLSLKLERKK